MDLSNGYEAIAPLFIEARSRSVAGIGSAAVAQWAGTLHPGSTILDLGCGTGLPVSKALIDQGMKVYGIDASPSLLAAFRQHFPDAPAICEPAENSTFFHRQFDGIIAWGLMFLLTETTQQNLIGRVAQALNPGGEFLFTAPSKVTDWKDVLTGNISRSLGADAYRALLQSRGLSIVGEFTDEGDNYYYQARKD